MLQEDAINSCPSNDKWLKLLTFVKSLTKERPDNDPFFKYVNESARDLLTEIGEL